MEIRDFFEKINVWALCSFELEGLKNILFHIVF
jgi:hypothetical protein